MHTTASSTCTLHRDSNDLVPVYVLLPACRAEVYTCMHSTASMHTPHVTSDFIKSAVWKSRPPRTYMLWDITLYFV